LDRPIADLDVIIRADPKSAAFIRERGAMKAKIGDQVGADAYGGAPPALPK